MEQDQGPEQPATPSREHLQVVKLFPKQEKKRNDKHDITTLERRLEMELDICDAGGYIIAWHHEAPIPDDVRKQIQQLHGVTPPATTRIQVGHSRVQSQWYDKFLGITIEWRIRHRIRRMKARFLELERNHQAIEGILDRS